jgi:hypothetical protein
MNPSQERRYHPIITVNHPRKMIRSEDIAGFSAN